MRLTRHPLVPGMLLPRSALAKTTARLASSSPKRLRKVLSRPRSVLASTSPHHASLMMTRLSRARKEIRSPTALTLSASSTSSLVVTTAVVRLNPPTHVRVLVTSINGISKTSLPLRSFRASSAVNRFVTSVGVMTNQRTHLRLSLALCIPDGTPKPISKSRMAKNRATSEWSNHSKIRVWAFTRTHSTTKARMSRQKRPSSKPVRSVLFQLCTTDPTARRTLRAIGI